MSDAMAEGGATGDGGATRDGVMRDGGGARDVRAATKAATHTEVYRRFRGTLRPARLRWAPLFLAGWRVATKQRIAMLLFFLPPLIATVIFSFVVYAKFALESGVTPSALGPGAGPATMAGAMAGRLIEVRHQIVLYNIGMSMFAILIMAWYGAGLIAEDRRLGAHLLYFARPMTRMDYLLGKLFVVGAFGLLVTLAPGMVICLVAAFASPHWSFVTEQGSVIVYTIVFALLWTLVVASTVLAISSLMRRRTYALVATFGWFMLTKGIAVLLAALQRDPRWLMLAPLDDLRRIAVWMFDVTGFTRMGYDWDVRASWAVIAALLAACWAILLARVKRMEVVA
jgi:ABC-type transport system involved in multi-copper enzyme maturation permease subunit